MRIPASHHIKIEESLRIIGAADPNINIKNAFLGSPSVQLGTNKRKVSNSPSPLLLRNSKLRTRSPSEENPLPEPIPN